MIPVTLTMHAFGPFSGEQVIDFTQLGNRRIFLITGETGAGKTTIYDAISFALYGNASGENRKSYTLKSHHAQDTDVCWVRYRFSLRAKEYEVYRQPLQPGKKRDGSPKELGEKAELTLPDGEVISGKQAVNAQIEAILGLSYHQFKQTIMLAQGEFRQLLEASSTQKQEIFSKIFGTDGYQAVTDALSARHGELGRQVQSEQQAIARVVRELGKLGFPALLDEDAQFLTYNAVTDAMAEGLSLHRARLEQLDEEIAFLEKEKAGIQLDQAKSLNDKLRRVGELQARLVSLQACSGEMQERRDLLQRLRAARELSEQEQIILATKTAKETAASRIQALTQRLEGLETGLRTAAAAFEQVDSLRGAAKQYAEEAAALREKEKQAEKLERRREAFARRQSELESSVTSLEALKETAAQLVLWDEKRTAKRQLELLTAYLDNRRQEQALEQQLAQMEREYERLYRAFVDNRAAQLAQGLRDGVACPVCGSQHHPLPAVLQGETIDESTVRRSKERLDKTRDKRVSYKLRISEIKGDFVTAKMEVPGEVSIPQLLDLILQLERRMAQIDASLPPAPPARTLGEVEQAIADGEHLIVGEKALLDSMKEELESHGDALSLQKIRQRIAALEQQYRQVTERAAQAEKEYHAVRGEADRALAERKTTESHRDELESQFAALREQFIARLRAGGFAGYSAYAEAAKDLERIPALAKETEDYDRESAQTKAQLEALLPDVAGKQPVDLKSLTERLSAIGKRLEALRENHTAVYSLLATADGRLRELKELYAQSGTLAKQFAIASELAALAKGSRGPGISFERYILASYFEDIIQIANIHLQRMTSSRYRLKRRADKTRGGSSGLDMEVIDSYTGTQRSVSTLSGGEGFKASLALALGLSDVVQIYAGGVSIDTMFIDEGFGSLDEKSLDSAVQTLLTLETSGRMVGIISHVSQLRDAIETKLSVRYAPTGSTASFEGIQ